MGDPGTQQKAPFSVSKERESSRILLTGASGFVGSRLLSRLDAMGYRIRCMSRRPGRLRFSPELAQTPELVQADLLDQASLERALDGVDAAYYLVHSMGGKNMREMRRFADRDKTAAENFVSAADRTGLSRLVYLGGLGDVDGSLSPHLASRQEVGDILLSAKAKTTVLRAAVIIGAGGAGFEIIRYLVEQLPLMICPKWVYTRSQPIWVEDVLVYLSKCIENRSTEDKTFDIGGPQVLSYADLMQMYARVRGLKRVILGVPFFSTHLSTYWVALFTPVPSGIVFPLAEGLRTPAVCREERIKTIIALDPTPMEQAICNALAEEEKGPGRLSSPKACFPAQN
jgi:uncharacterized protein YbjT (DUF2867 family)